MNFNELGLRPEIEKALNELGITAPTDIQAQAIPHVLKGYDVIGMSKTGSGKTAAFGLPMLEQVVPGEGLQVLILAPTRELVVQIADEMKKFGKYVKCKIATVYGGVSLSPQVEAMRKSEIVVATTGRLLDHLSRRNVTLDDICVLVLDEADKMVEMGFIDDIHRILKATPEDRQILLFGATISNEIDDLRNKFMYDPVTVKAESKVKEEFLEQYYYVVPQHLKFSLLIHLLGQEEKRGGVIIFCSTRRNVDAVNFNLRKKGYKTEALHGKLTQAKRSRVMERFHAGEVDVLVASAVAARGLHIDDVSHVYNYDLSQDPQEYVHRVGRTARAGSHGKAYTLLSDRDFEVFNDILSRYDLKVTELDLPEFPRIPFLKEERLPRRGRRPHGGGHRSGDSSYESDGGQYSGGHHRQRPQERGHHFR